MPSTNSQLMDLFAKRQVELAQIGEHHGRRRVSVARVEVDATEANQHIFRMTKLFAHDRIVSIAGLASAAMTGYTSANIEVMIPPPPGSSTDPSSVPGTNPICSGFGGFATLPDPRVPQEMLGDGRALFASNMGKPLWEMSELAVEPMIGTVWEVNLIGSAIFSNAVPGIIGITFEYISRD